MVKQVTQFEVHFDNERTLFIPGQKIEGYVALALNSSLDINHLRIRFYGKVVTHLHKSDDGYALLIRIANENSTITMFKDFNDLVGGTTLQTGEYVYPFNFRMPSTSLPASFGGSYGRVQYTISASLKPKNKQKSVLFKTLTVPSTRDAADQDLQDPVNETVKGLAGAFWWKNGYFEVEASLPKRGFTSGIND